METTSICGEWHWMVRMSVDWRWLQCVRCLLCLSLCVWSRRVVVLVKTHFRRLTTRWSWLRDQCCWSWLLLLHLQEGYVMLGIYLSVCLSETLDNEMELIERSVLFKSVISVTSARRLCNARRLSVCLSVWDTWQRDGVDWVISAVQVDHYYCLCKQVM